MTNPIFNKMNCIFIENQPITKSISSFRFEEYFEGLIYHWKGVKNIAISLNYSEYSIKSTDRHKDYIIIYTMNNLYDDENNSVYVTQKYMYKKDTYNLFGETHIFTIKELERYVMSQL